jgi:tyrosinase
MPGFPTNVFNIEPNRIIDSRTNDMKVWFAENGRVVLDRYTVNSTNTTNSTEFYTYTGIIEAGNRRNLAKNLNGTIVNYVTGPFTVPSGTTCNMLSGTEILLNPGFEAAIGSTLNANIDPLSNPSGFFNSARVGSDILATQVSKPDINQMIEDAVDVYPNPSTGRFNVYLMLKERKPYQYQVFDQLGKLVISSSSDPSSDLAFEVDLTNQPPQMYILRVTTQNRSFTKKLIVR